MEAWAKLEAGLLSMAHDNSLTGVQGMPPVRVVEFLRTANILSIEERREIEELRHLRNKVVHGTLDHREVLNHEVVQRLRSLLERFSED